MTDLWRRALAAFALMSLVAGTTSGPASASVTATPAPDGPAARETSTVAAAVAPGTIVFLKNHNVWLARGDGSGQYQVTRNGTLEAPYLSPSMADNGTIAAIRLNQLVTMRQNGELRRPPFTPPALPDSLGHLESRFLVYAAISPDATKIAYTYTGHTCDPTAGCGFRGSTGITDAASPTPPSVHGSNYYAQPSWVGNGRIMVHGGYGSHMRLDDVGPGEAEHWFDDSDIHGDLESTDLGDGEVSADGTWLTAVRGYGDSTHVVWYSVTGDPFDGAVATLPTPTELCLTNAAAGFASPTWSPDSTSLAIETPDGIYVGGNVQGCETATWSLALPSGSAPDWSPAALNPPLRSFTLLKRPVAKGIARVGRRLSATPGQWSPKPAKVRYQWLRNGKRIRAATNRTYLLRRIDRGRRIAVRVTVSRSTYKARSATSAARRIR